MAVIGPTNAILINGTQASDVITGGFTNQTINGLGGHDRILAEGGNDSLFGGPGNDSLFGGTGNDSVVGGDDNDFLSGGIGNDSLFGNDGNDGVYGEDGNDILYGEDGNDSLFGGRGNDYLSGGAGNDSLVGGAGNDSLVGGTGNDRLVGVDPFAANPGRGEIDRLTGSSGIDRFVLGDVNNVYYDDDIAATTGTNDYALITDFQSGQDTIELKGGVNYRLQNVDLGGGVSGRGIYVDNPGFLIDELIGVIQGIQPFTPLIINNGANITTITGLGIAPLV